MGFRQKAKFIRLYAESLLRNKRSVELLRHMRTYCMFVGYPRTGHSLIGSLLDAHPNIIIAHELDALALFQRGFSRHQVFHLVLENSKKMAAAGRSHTGYSYEVPNQWQGRFDKIQVIGDKKGARSAMCFYRHPDLLEVVRNKIGKELKFVHVIRSPYDVLATMTRRSRSKTLEVNTENFFKLCASVMALKKKLQPAEIFDLRLETFVEAPKLHLERLCAFLGVEADQRYLEDCASIVFKSSKKSRFDIEWSKESLANVRNRSEAFDFLTGYDFEEDTRSRLTSSPSTVAVDYPNKRIS
jgi:Sulfotransferase family